MPGNCVFSVFQARYAATQTRNGDGCPAHCAGASRLFEHGQSRASLKLLWRRIPSPLCVCVSPREVEQGLPAAKLWDATLGGASRRRRRLGAHAERRRSHPGCAGKALLLASYGTAIACAVSGALLSVTFLGHARKVTRASARNLRPINGIQRNRPLHHLNDHSWLSFVHNQVIC